MIDMTPKMVKVNMPYDGGKAIKDIIYLVIKYHDALRNRENGDVASHQLVKELEKMFGMNYDQFRFYHL